jgi:PEP-CTERM motif-containing protein
VKLLRKTIAALAVITLLLVTSGPVSACYFTFHAVESIHTNVNYDGYDYDYCSSVDFQTKGWFMGMNILTLDFINLTQNPFDIGLSSYNYAHTLPADLSVPPSEIIKATWVLKGNWIDADDTSNVVAFESQIGFFLTGQCGWDWTVIDLTMENLWNQADGQLDTTIGSLDDCYAEIHNACLFLDYENRDPNAPNVPEPITMLLFGTGIAGLTVIRRKK